MLKYVFIRLSLLWLALIILIGVTLWIAPRLPSKGTLLLTHNVFLNRYNRFEFYDISRGILYGYTPYLGESVTSASLAPNGRYMAVVSIERGQYSLNIMSLTGRVITRPITSTNIRLGSWSPNSRYLTYADGSSNFFILDLSTPTVRQIESILTIPSWSFDSEQIAFVGFADSSPQILVADVDGNNHYQLSENNGICPTWSPDGETVAYFSDSNQLQFVRLDGTINDDYLSSEWRLASCPSWSADGRYITFMAFLTDVYTTDIVLLDVFTGEAEIILEVEQTTNIQWWR